MYPLKELLKNDTSLVAGFLTLVTGLLTGPLFHIDSVTAGTLTGMVGLALTVWVRASVYSKKSAAEAATNAAVQAVQSVTANTAGDLGVVTTEAAQSIREAVQDAVPNTQAPTVTPIAA